MFAGPHCDEGTFPHWEDNDKNENGDENKNDKSIQSNVEFLSSDDKSELLKLFY